MFPFNDAYKNTLAIAWKKFIHNESWDFSFMRPDIYESWKRSRSYLVDPYHIKTALLPPEELNMRINSNLALIDTTRPYMENLYSIVAGSGFYLMLADRDGYILDLLGDKDIIEKGKTTKLVVGASRSEEYAGTNAIGTCLALKKPLQTWNEEHYIVYHKDYSCSSAPILDPTDNLLGCLNITGLNTDIHTHTLGMVISAVDGITKELRIRRAYEEIQLISAQRNSIIEAVSSGLILLNQSDHIIQINKNALRMLQWSYEDVIGKTLSDLISIDDPDRRDFTFSSIPGEAYNRDTNLYFRNSTSPPLKFNMSVDFILDSRSKRSDTLIRLNEPKTINKLVSKINGYGSHYTFDSIIGSSSAIQKMIQTGKRAAQSSSNVLILGESGTGKELVAQSIHNASAYASGPFVAINCGALPKGLIESELFGYERGAFTGANKEGHPGKFELADGGTIFLDEIGDMPLDVQISLLRVIQTREIIRIGGKFPKTVNVRIVAATNRDLEEAIESKTFREDLYYRLNVFTINIPPLREREQDAAILADEFLKTFSSSKNQEYHIVPEVYTILTQYPWPGNVRELENAIERAVNITDDNQIRIEHLPTGLQNFALSLSQSPAVTGMDSMTNADSATNTGSMTNADSVEQVHVSSISSDASINIASASATSILDSGGKNGAETPPSFRLDASSHQLILSCLEKTDGNVKEAAELLGISRRTLYRKMEKLGIDYQTYRQHKPE